MLRASFEPRTARLSTGCLPDIRDSVASERASERTNDQIGSSDARVALVGRRRERRDREAFVYINQLVCTAIITVIGAAITDERVR